MVQGPVRTRVRARVRACACPSVRAYVRVHVYMYARVRGCVYVCVVGRSTALHGLYGVLCIVAMQGSVRGALTRRRALNPRAGVTMHDAYGNSR